MPLTMFVNTMREKNTTNCIMLETNGRKLQIIMCRIRQLVLTSVINVIFNMHVIQLYIVLIWVSFLRILSISSDSVLLQVIWCMRTGPHSTGWKTVIARCVTNFFFLETEHLWRVVKSRVLKVEFLVHRNISSECVNLMSIALDYPSRTT